jgi:hypothetical protein
MRFLGIDLAGRYSAAVLLDKAGSILGEWTVDVGPARVPPEPQAHLAELTLFWNDILTKLSVPTVVGLEDIHVFAVNPKPALRLSGALLMLAFEAGVDVQLIRALTWQAHHGYKKTKGRTSKGWAKERCEELGYSPDTVGKMSIDLRDAFLIATYLKDQEQLTEPS